MTSDTIVFNFRWYPIQERVWAMLVPGGVLLKLQENVTTITFVAGLSVRVNSYQDGFSDLIVIPTASALVSVQDERLARTTSMLCVCGKAMWQHKLEPHCDGFVFVKSTEELQECQICGLTMGQHIGNLVCSGFVPKRK